MVNERISETIVRTHFGTLAGAIVLEEQKSSNSRIHNLLRNASKTRNRERGDTLNLSYGRTKSLAY